MIAAAWVGDDQMKSLLFGVGLAVAATAAAFAAEERQFSTGVRWVPLGGTTESYVRVEPKAPVCGGGRTIIIVFESRQQAESEAVVNDAILSAVRSLMVTCTTIRNIGVEGHLRENDHPDSAGVVPWDLRMLSAKVGVSSSEPRIFLLYNKVLAEKLERERATAAAAAQAELDAKLAKQQIEDEKKRQEDEALFKSQQAEVADHIAGVRALAQPQSSSLGLFGSSSEQKLVGVWSNPDGLCDTDLFVFYVQNDKHVAEFWSHVSKLRLAPVFQGDWTLDNDIVQLHYTKQLVPDGLGEAVKIKEEPVSGRVRLISAEKDNLTITAKGVSDPLPFLLFYPERSKLLRCK